MSSSIPLIRAASAATIEYTLRRSGRYDPEVFRASGLPDTPSADPHRLVSMHAHLNLLRRLTESEGPDFACRTTTPETLMMLGVPTSAVRASRTIREAILKVAHTFHLQASHVFFLAQPVAGGIEVTEAFQAGSDQIALHAGHQQVVGMLSALGRIVGGRPLPARIRLSPHPVFGVEHLKPHLGADVEACDRHELRVFIADSALDRRLPWEPVPFPSHGPSLVSACSPNMSASARILIEGMVRDGSPCLDALALAAGRSRRTMQRLLAAEGVSFADLVDSVRRDFALEGLRGTSDSVAAVAGGVGYRNTSSLSRAVRRWTDACPRNFRGTARLRA